MTANRAPEQDLLQLNLGCGQDLRGPHGGWLNVADRIPEGYVTNGPPCPPGSVVALYDIDDVEEPSGTYYTFQRVDLDDTPWPWDDDAAIQVLASHVLEHLDDVVAFMDEAHRVLKPAGTLEVRVPHYQHPNAHQDPTHRHTFTPGSLDYFLDDMPSNLHRLSDRRWKLLDKQILGGWDRVPARWRHWARRLHRWTRWDPRPSPEEIRWKLTPGPRCEW